MIQKHQTALKHCVMTSWVHTFLQFLNYCKTDHTDISRCSSPQFPQGGDVLCAVSVLSVNNTNKYRVSITKSPSRIRIMDMITRLYAHVTFRTHGSGSVCAVQGRSNWIWAGHDPPSFTQRCLFVPEGWTNTQLSSNINLDHHKYFRVTQICEPGSR